MGLLERGAWTRWSPEVPAKLGHSVIKCNLPLKRLVLLLPLLFLEKKKKIVLFMINFNFQPSQFLDPVHLLADKSRRKQRQNCLQLSH